MVSKRFDEPARCGLVRTAFIRQSRRTLGLQLRIRRGNRAFEIFGRVPERRDRPLVPRVRDMSWPVEIGRSLTTVAPGSHDLRL